MEDIGPPPYEAARIEIWINKQLKNAQLPEYIADELLKKWDASELLIDTKSVVARFCLLNGFYPSLIRILKLDLRSGAPLPWPQVLELFYNLKGAEVHKDLADAVLSGATRDKQLYGTAAVALRNGETDSRWANILEGELKEKMAGAKEERERLFRELQIYKAERMDAEMAQALLRILALFPKDAEATSLYERLGEQELDVRLDRLRQQFRPKEKLLVPPEEEEKWPELDGALKKIQKTLTLEQTYLLSIALFQMNFFEKALRTLRFVKPKWNVREKLWEAELLLCVASYAESLSAAQIVLNENRTDNNVVKNALYLSARAYYGLGDQEQAASILRGITEHDPHYRDAAILLVEWEQ